MSELLPRAAALSTQTKRGARGNIYHGRNESESDVFSISQRYRITDRAECIKGFHL
jgi:hypothetical protein